MSGRISDEDFRAALAEMKEYRANGGSYVSDFPLTITEVSGDGSVVRPVTFDHRTLRVFHRIFDTLIELAANPPAARDLIIFNGVKATPLGWATVLPLPTAIEWARSVREISTNPLPCDYCTTGDGGFGLARVDYCQYTFIARICETCHEAVFGGDDDD